VLRRLIGLSIVIGIVVFIINGCGEGNQPLLSTTMRDDGVPPGAPQWKDFAYTVENVFKNHYKVTLKWNKVTVNKDNKPKNNIAGYKVLKADASGSLIATYMVPTRTGGSDEFFVDTDPNLTEGKQYSYRIVAFDTFFREGPSSSPQVVRIQAQSSDKPAPPTRFNYTTTDREIIVYWEPVTTYEDGSPIDGNLEGYELFRSIGNVVPDIPLAIVSPEQNSYVDKLIEYGQTYNYWLRAVDKKGAKSIMSSPIAVVVSSPTQPTSENDTKKAITIPCPPYMQSVTSVNNADGTVTWTINWTASPYNDDGTTLDDVAIYRVYRAEAQAGIYTLLAATAVSPYTYTTPSTKQYWYKVSAVDFYGNESTLSGAGSLNITLGNIQQTGLNLRWDNLLSSTKKITIVWDDLETSPTAITSYNVYRALARTGPWVKIGSRTDIGDTGSSPDYTFEDGNVIFATSGEPITYYYRLSAVNTDGESGLSYYVKVTPTTVSYKIEGQSFMVTDANPTLTSSTPWAGVLSNSVAEDNLTFYYRPSATNPTDNYVTVKLGTINAGVYDITLAYVKGGSKHGVYLVELIREGFLSQTIKQWTTTLNSVTPNTDDGTEMLEKSTMQNVQLPATTDYYLKLTFQSAGSGDNACEIDYIGFTPK